MYQISNIKYQMSNIIFLCVGGQTAETLPYPCDGVHRYAIGRQLSRRRPRNVCKQRIVQDFAVPQQPDPPGEYFFKQGHLNLREPLMQLQTYVLR